MRWILAVFDALADYVAQPNFRGCPFVNAAAEAREASAEHVATEPYRAGCVARVTRVDSPKKLANQFGAALRRAMATAQMDKTNEAAAATTGDHPV